MSRKKNEEDRKPIEQEIAELQRKFRVLENDKRAYTEDSQGIIRKQRATIEKLTRDNRKMKMELNGVCGASNAGLEKKIALEACGKLTEQKDQMQAQYDEEVKRNNKLEEQLNVTTKNVFVMRERMAALGGVNASLENSKAVQKQIRVLENRLDKALQRFNEAITTNKKLREDIDLLRRERVVFNDICRKLDNELALKKREMANIIEQANAAYMARDSAQAEMAALKQQADREHVDFAKEWRELGHLIENDKRMKELMRRKLRSAEAKISGSQKANSQKKIVTKCITDTQTSQMNITANQENIAAFEEAFARIQAATGICDIDDLVQNFIDGEDQNFTLYKYNNLLSADMEKLEQQIADYNEEYINLSGSSKRKEDTERLKSLESLEEAWTSVERKAEWFDMKYQEAHSTLTHVRDQIHANFIKLQCSAEHLPSGCAAGISEYNMMAFLAVIESRANDLLKIYEQSQGENNEDFDAMGASRVQGSSANLQINLPSTVEDNSDDENDEDEDDRRPFTRDELKAKTLKSISKNQKKTRMKGVAHEK